MSLVAKSVIWLTLKKQFRHDVQGVTMAQNGGQQGPRQQQQQPLVNHNASLEERSTWDRRASLLSDHIMRNGLTRDSLTELL
jgi:hypothetical protein